MTTSTSKHVERVTDDAYASRIIGTKPRRIVVKIAGRQLILRLHGTQQREYVNIVDVFERARSNRVLAERATKMAARRKKKA